MVDLSLHILDVAENALAAGASRIAIRITEETNRDRMSIEIDDNGKGMEPATAARAADPFFTTRTTRRVGLGLSLLEAAAHAAEGTLQVRSVPGAGTNVVATFQLSHIDRKPLGDIAATIAMLLAGKPDLDLRFIHERDGRTIRFTTEECRKYLGGYPLGSVDTLKFIREYIAQEEEALHISA